MKSILSAAIAFLAFTGIAAAAGQAPVAVVEDVQGKVTGVQFMDYVVPGQVIKLGEGGTVTLSYMKSCWRETISGIGTVLVGTDQSSVHLSQFKADNGPCDLSMAPLTRGKFYDLAKANIALTPGGTYSIALNSKSAKIVVAADARPGAS